MRIPVLDKRIFQPGIKVSAIMDFDMLLRF